MFLGSKDMFHKAEKVSGLPRYDDRGDNKFKKITHSGTARALSFVFFVIESADILDPFG